MASRKERPTYKRYRFPIQIIQQCVWLYFRFSISFRDVELMMAERGVVVSYESIRQWCLKFGEEYAQKLRKKRGQPGDKWHLDEIKIKIGGKTHYLGGRSIRMAWYWIFWLRAGATKRRSNASSLYIDVEPE